MVTHGISQLTWKRIIASGLALVGVVGLIVCYSIYRMVAVIIPHSYAAWTTGDLLVEYMETHDGRWPRGWEDLSKAKESLVQKNRNIYFQFDRLPMVVKVDWNAEPAALAKSVQAGGESAINVVTQPDGSKLEAKWGPDTEPNGKVARYLIQRLSAQKAAPSSGNAFPTSLTLPK